MLGSITPLGERSRKQRWGVTVAFYLAGAGVAGAALGGFLGLMGSALVQQMSSSLHAVMLGLVLTVGLIFELHFLRLRLPTVRRQVSERWLTRYRGWAYGLGFGIQLGLGVVTIVPSATIYATLAVAFLSGSLWYGLLIGTSFGAVRGGLPLAVAWVRDVKDFERIDLMLKIWRPRVYWTSLSAHLLFVGILFGIVAW